MEKYIIKSSSIVYAKDLNEFIHLLLPDPSAAWENNRYPLDESTEIWVNAQYKTTESVPYRRCVSRRLPPETMEEIIPPANEKPPLFKRVVFGVEEQLDGEKRYEFEGVYALEKQDLSTGRRIWRRVSESFSIEKISSVGLVGESSYSDDEGICEKIIYIPRPLHSKKEIDNGFEKLKESAYLLWGEELRSNGRIIAWDEDRCKEYLTRQYACDCCGSEFSIRQVGTKWLGIGGMFERKECAIDPLQRYRNVARNFSALGFSASVSCLCPECAERMHPRGFGENAQHFVFTFRAGGDDVEHFSYLDPERFDDYAYKVALAFLKGADTWEKMDAQGGYGRGRRNDICYMVWRILFRT
ncbi:MAG: hypothetical protein IJW22_05175 [Clostridia bacterium]|nr:hypothetical protein [Clostridia bacterium]